MDVCQYFGRDVKDTCNKIAVTFIIDDEWNKRNVCEHHIYKTFHKGQWSRADLEFIITAVQQNGMAVEIVKPFNK